MELVEQLQQLQELREKGALSEEEFQQAKQVLLAGTPPMKVETTPEREESLARLQREAEVARIDREWDYQREQYMVRGKYGNRYYPSRFAGIASMVIGTLFGLIWIGVSLGSNAPTFFPLIGIVVIVAGIANGVASFSKADSLQEAEEEYRNRRSRAYRGE